MPELPEVETMVRGIRPQVEGRCIAAFRACACDCKPMTVEPSTSEIARRVRGKMITEVVRRAKRVVLKLESGDAFVIEPRMTGLMLIDEPPDPDHLRFEWLFADDRPVMRLQFWDRRGLGTLRLLSAEQLAGLMGFEYLGRDALEMTSEHWADVCASTSTPIKVAMLDQKRVAGIGNLYASEILHLARVSPVAPAKSLKRPQIDRIAVAVLEVLRTAIKYEGSTLSDGTYRNALNKEGGYQNAHRVYDREGDLCPSCSRGRVLRIVQSQRSTFYCPVCQPERRVR